MVNLVAACIAPKTHISGADETGSYKFICETQIQKMVSRKANHLKAQPQERLNRKAKAF